MIILRLITYPIDSKKSPSYHFFDCHIDQEITEWGQWTFEKGVGVGRGLVLCTNYHLTFTHWVWPLSSHRQITDIMIIMVISLAWVLGIAPYNQLLVSWYQMHMVIEVMFSFGAMMVLVCW